MGIADVFGVDVDEEKVKKFEKLGKKKGCSSAAEKRRLEMGTLFPGETFSYRTKKSRNVFKTFAEYTVQVAFMNKKDLRLFRKYIHVNFRNGMNTSDTEILLALFRSLDSKKLKYDKKKGRLYILVEKQGKKYKRFL